MFDMSPGTLIAFAGLLLTILGICARGVWYMSATYAEVRSISAAVSASSKRADQHSDEFIEQGKRLGEHSVRLTRLETIVDKHHPECSP